MSDGETHGSPGMCPRAPTQESHSQQDLIFNSRQRESLFIRTGFIFRAGMPVAIPVTPRVSKSSLGFTFLWLMRGVPRGSLLPRSEADGAAVLLSSSSEHPPGTYCWTVMFGQRRFPSGYKKGWCEEPFLASASTSPGEAMGVLSR